jgi:5-methylcytosine-specific restriction protein A
MSPVYIEAVGDLYGRAVKEWVGKTPDTPVPDHVKDRIFLRQDRKCALSGRAFMAGDGLIADHRVRLKDGGQNRESNIQIVLGKPHIEKTTEENSEGARIDRIRQKHYGMRKPRQKIRSRGFEKRTTA